MWSYFYSEKVIKKAAHGPGCFDKRKEIESDVANLKVRWEYIKQHELFNIFTNILKLSPITKARFMYLFKWFIKNYYFQFNF